MGVYGGPVGYDIHCAAKVAGRLWEDVRRSEGYCRLAPEWW